MPGGNPALLSNEDPDKVGRANRAVSQAYRPALELITRHEINWTIVASATPAWAAAMFPDDAPDVALAKLWEAIFQTTRINTDDPVAAWKTHDAGLHKRAALLNEKRYAALQYRGPGTDFRLGLADDHLWLGGGTTAGNGLYCIPNMPTEEVFTTPHKDRAEGTVTATKPLSHQGTMIEGIQVRFEKGRIVEAHATQRPGSAAEADRHRRRRAAAGRSGAGAALVADCRQRTAVPEHALRRERGIAHCAGPGLHAPACATATS